MARLTPELKAYLEGEDTGYLHVKELTLPDGDIIIVGICRMMFTVGMCYDLDETGIGGRFCYPTMLDAVEALKIWKGEMYPPGNWIKHKGRIGEYPNPNPDQD